MAQHMLTPPEVGEITDPRRNLSSSKVDSSSHMLGETVATANAAGSTTTLVCLTAGADGANAVRKGDRVEVVRAGVPLDSGKVVQVTAVAKAANDTITFTPALSVATANGDVMKTVNPTAYNDNDSLDARLIAIGGIYTQKYVDSMTQNDKMYAIRLNDDAGSFKP